MGKNVNFIINNKMPENFFVVNLTERRLPIVLYLVKNRTDSQSE